MKKLSLSLLVLLATAAASQVRASDYVQGEILVKYRENFRRDLTSMNTFYEKLAVQDVERFNGLGSGFEKLKFSTDIKVQDAIFEAMKNPGVESAQPNYILRIQPVSRPSASRSEKFKFDSSLFSIFGSGGWPSESASRPEVLPPAADVNPPVADPRMDELYGIKMIQAPEVWDQNTKGSRNITVAVIDTGIDYNNEDLSGNVWRNPNPSEQNDIVGFDFIHNDGLPFDDNSHGTHTAGTIGGVGGNGKGVSGVMQKVLIMGVKFLSGRGSGTTADAVKSIDYAINKGAKVLSNSWGGTADKDNDMLEQAIQRAEQKDVLFIAAAGNESTNNDTSDQRSFPASFTTENMISVAATDSMDRLASFSNYGEKTTHLAAPGVDILSSVPGNGYKKYSGTSMACPHVAGAAAMVWSKHPHWTYKQVKAALLNSVDVIPGLSGKVATSGRLNLMKAMAQ
jgi:subtilisin family serine protease